MTTQQLELANNLDKQINDLQRIISNIDNQKCEWIDFTLGNGSNRSCVCNDLDIINKVKDLLRKENIIKLERLKGQFKLV